MVYFWSYLDSLLFASCVPCVSHGSMGTILTFITATKSRTIWIVVSHPRIPLLFKIHNHSASNENTDETNIHHLRSDRLTDVMMIHFFL